MTGRLKRAAVWLAVAGAFLLPAAAQTQSFRVMEYNVENFFDTRHDSLKHDEEFLPSGVRGWNRFRFQEKSDKIAKVILAASGDQVPDLVALCEVENDYCLRSLTRYSPLRDAAYKYVMTDSPDERGIDVALLYQPATFRLLGARSVRIPLEHLGHRPTRDILHVTGRVVSGDTLDVFVCHFPSRSGGRKQSEPYRLMAASCLRQAIDSVGASRQCFHLIVTGDFNDCPADRSIREVLGASRPSGDCHPSWHLYNLMDGKPGGTYRYKGEWNILDQIIVNGKLLQENSSVCTGYEKARILVFPFLLEEDERYGGDTPFRMYKGMRYQGGYSDHLPVCLDLEIKEGQP